jgi:hypothetical protein
VNNMLKVSGVDLQLRQPANDLPSCHCRIYLYKIKKLNDCNNNH